MFYVCICCKQRIVFLFFSRLHLWIYNTIPFGFSLLWHFWDATFQLLKLLYLVKDHWRGFSSWNESMVHISNLFRFKYCEYILNEVSFHISTTWWVSLLVDQWVPEGTCSQLQKSTLVDSKRFKSIKIFLADIDWNCNFMGLLYHPCWLQLVLALLWRHFPTFETTLFGLW